ncbi:Gfo/Idh/MocA family oxidoreductase [Oceanobacillus oncorhynchi subsp. oncorhynchi]|uniref:Gfo/Idh/MocA family protein n=1 Tax=Oceanobacillus oncorhynchi TaxID=545501 RepID=UPI0031CE1B57
MKLGIVGAGGIVKTVLSFIGEIDEIVLKAISATTASEEMLKTLCTDYNIPNYYTDVNQMLQDKEIEVVYIAVPNHLHYLFTRKALKAGKHVICEKPFTSNLKEAKDLISLAEKLNLIILEGVNTRYLPNTLKIKEVLNKIGKIKIVSMNYSQYSSRYDAFREGNILPAFNPDMSGGALMDLNIYNINFAVFLFGEPKNLSYEANIEKGIDTSGILTLDYEDFKCVSIAAKDCKAPMMTTIQGDKGCIVIDSSLNLINNYKIIMNENSHV